jgi:hypothetical protein
MQVLNDRAVKILVTSHPVCPGIASSLGRSILFVSSFLLTALHCGGQSSVVTYQYDNARTGQNTSETILTPSNVNVNQFGKLFALPVDGHVYAQPLYVANLAIAGGKHNVLFVATEADSVYAFDSDSNTGPNSTWLWKASLVDTAHGASAGETPMSETTLGCDNISPLIGITSTPVIDLSSGTMYVEAKSTDGLTFYHRLHALDITTGNEKSPQSPVVIKEPLNFTPTFNSLHQHNRPGLLLMSGTIFIGFASHCDYNPYNGWLFAYDTTTLTQKGVFNTTPSSSNGRGGIWMSGSGLAADGNGNIYVATGNGTFSQANPLNLGDSILKFNFSNGKLSLADYFTPYNQSSLNTSDTDLGSGGVSLLPDQPGTHPHLLVAAGKQGRIYLLDRDQLTSKPQAPTQTEPYCANCGSDPQIVQESISGQVGGMWSMPAYWNNALYFWGSSDVLKSIPLSNGRLDFAHLTSSIVSYRFPGATPSISASGTSNGIVWSIDSSRFSPGGSTAGPALLYAHDAANVSRQLWNSTQAPNGRDQAGNAVKFTVPRIANGKVYVGTTTEVDVYGLFPPPMPPTITTQPANQTVTADQTATFTVAASGSPPPTYQWQRNGVNISGMAATQASYTTPPTGTADNNSTFQVVVSNPQGMVTSNPATLTVLPPATGGIAPVQHASKDSGVTTSSSLAFVSANTTGNWIAVVVRAGSSNTQVFKVSDSNANVPTGHNRKPNHLCHFLRREHQGRCEYHYRIRHGLGSAAIRHPGVFGSRDREFAGCNGNGARDQHIAE